MMKEHFLVGSNKAFAEPNIYGDKSSLILEWLLLIGVKKEQFSIREIAGATGISLGQVQKVVGVLTMNGNLEVIGVRTAKRFILKRPQNLLQKWLEHYSLIKKCKMHSYHTAFQGRHELIEALSKSSMNKKVVLALHSAADTLKFKNTNLDTLELYLLDVDSRLQVEKLLKLEPQERGYEVLLIEPYYKSLLYHSPTSEDTSLLHSPILLTLLDLYHFPLRGREQAEFMAERLPDLKRIYKREH